MRKRQAGEERDFGRGRICLMSSFDVQSAVAATAQGKRDKEK
jgi:hypothetical protein